MGVEHHDYPRSTASQNLSIISLAHTRNSGTLGKYPYHWATKPFYLETYIGNLSLLGEDHWITKPF